MHVFTIQIWTNVNISHLLLLFSDSLLFVNVIQLYRVTNNANYTKKLTVIHEFISSKMAAMLASVQICSSKNGVTTNIDLSHTVILYLPKLQYGFPYSRHFQILYV